MQKKNLLLLTLTAAIAVVTFILKRKEDKKLNFTRRSEEEYLGV